MKRLAYAQGIEIRQKDGEQHLSGYVVRYDDIAKVGPFTERIAPGALKPEDRVEVNVQHDRGRVIGVVPDTAELSGTHTGVKINIRLLQTRETRDVVEYVRAGVLTGFSSEFIPLKLDRQGDNVTILEARFMAVGIVSTPAYPKSKAALRSIQEAFAALPDSAVGGKPAVADTPLYVNPW